MPRALAALLLALPAAGALGCAKLGRRASIIYSSVASELSPDRVLVDLKRSFIEDYQHRVTIQASFTVDAASGSPNPAVFDGDLHFAGRAPEIGLRLVGEIKNAGEAEAAVDQVTQAQASRRPLLLVGAWRLWPEHAVGPRHEQGRPAAPLTNINPDHVFEIHPITRIDGRSLLTTLHPVEGYRPGSPKTFQDVYEKAKLGIRVEPDKVTLTLPTGLYNDVHFWLEPLAERPQIVGDGRFIWGAAYDESGNRLVPRLRMVLIRGSEPERLLQGLRPGSRRRVWGLPRVSLAEVAKRLRTVPPGGSAPEQEGPLPYEIVIVGVYPEERR